MDEVRSINYLRIINSMQRILPRDDQITQEIAELQTEVQQQVEGGQNVPEYPQQHIDHLVLQRVSRQDSTESAPEEEDPERDNNVQSSSDEGELPEFQGLSGRLPFEPAPLILSWNGPFIHQSNGSISKEPETSFRQPGTEIVGIVRISGSVLQDDQFPLTIHLSDQMIVEEEEVGEDISDSERSEEREE